MNWLFIVIGVLIVLFGFVVAFGAPYLPTLRPQADGALDLLNLQPGQILLELGCGDGRVAKAAARRGLRVVGYELNPLLVVIAKLHTWPERRLVTICWGNFWRAKWPPADGIFVFLLDKYMKKLDTKIVQQRAIQKRPIKLLSFTFKVPGRQPDQQKTGLYLYHY